MDYLKNITPGKVPDRINVIVEIPKGSQNKYEYDKKLGIFKLDRVLFSPIHYPGDYGFVPQTLGEDNDPLDTLVLVSHATYPGMLIEARPIGVLHMIDNGERDDKILAVPTTDPRFGDYKDIKAVQKHILDEIAHFFAVYKQLEGKKVEILGWKGVKEAEGIIVKSVERYSKSI